VLDRETGQHVFPVDDVPVPASTVPGEEASLTQPVPRKPAPLARQTITEADLMSFAGLTGDFSELHTSDVYGKNSQFGRRVAHGMLGLAYAHGLMWPRTGELRETAIAFLGITEGATAFVPLERKALQR
jgi:acyl dehydratase